jgi:hypothetical protein
VTTSQVWFGFYEQKLICDNCYGQASSYSKCTCFLDYMEPVLETKGAGMPLINLNLLLIENCRTNRHIASPLPIT